MHDRIVLSYAVTPYDECTPKSVIGLLTDYRPRTKSCLKDCWSWHPMQLWQWHVVVYFSAKKVSLLCLHCHVISIYVHRCVIQAFQTWTPFAPRSLRCAGIVRKLLLDCSVKAGWYIWITWLQQASLKHCTISESRFKHCTVPYASYMVCMMTRHGIHRCAQLHYLHEGMHVTLPPAMQAVTT